MQSFWWALGSLIILCPIIYFSPLELSHRGKWIVLALSFLMGVLGLLAEVILPIWEILVLFIVLIGLIAYISDKKFAAVLYSPARSTIQEGGGDQSITKSEKDFHKTFANDELSPISEKKPFDYGNEQFNQTFPYDLGNPGVADTPESPMLQTIPEINMEDLEERDETNKVSQNNDPVLEKSNDLFEERDFSESEERHTYDEDEKELSTDEGIRIATLGDTDIPVKEDNPFTEREDALTDGEIHSQDQEEKVLPLNEPGYLAEIEDLIKRELSEDENMSESSHSLLPELGVLPSEEEEKHAQPLPEPEIKQEDKLLSNDADIEEIPAEDELDQNDHPNAVENQFETITNHDDMKDLPPLSNDENPESAQAAEAMSDFQTDKPLTDEPELLFALEETAAAIGGEEADELRETLLPGNDHLNEEHEPTVDTGKKRIQKELLHNMVAQLEVAARELEPSQYETLVKHHLQAGLSVHDYYTFARLLMEHYIRMDQYKELENLISEIKLRVAGYPILEQEAEYVYNRYCKNTYNLS